MATNPERDNDSAAELAALRAKVDTLETMVNELNGKVYDLYSTVLGLDTKVFRLEATVVNMGAKVAEMWDRGAKSRSDADVKTLWEAKTKHDHCQRYENW
jgi:outer membrane murein-binding lipoprotein Lpp